MARSPFGRLPVPPPLPRLAPLFDCAAAWDGLEAANRRALGAALIAERLAWAGYAGGLGRDGLRDCALQASGFIHERLRWTLPAFGLTPPPVPDLRGCFPGAPQCLRCGKPDPLVREPDVDRGGLVCDLCWRLDLRQAEHERLQALLGRQV